jgi:hypothetical protein
LRNKQKAFSPQVVDGMAWFLLATLGWVPNYSNGPSVAFSTAISYKEWSHIKINAFHG